MSNLVLYRKYRPQSFVDMIGQEHIVQALGNSISAQNISHAYLFCGPRGSGKTTVARLFAKAVNCENRKGAEPCNKCPTCMEITEGRSIDLVEIDAASHTGVDNIREIIESTKFSPVKSKYKIFIIDECHQLSKSAANALLKTLEEPPAHAIFLLATTEAQKMLPTIISRCQRFDFRRLKSSQIVQKLEIIAKKEEVKFDKSALLLIAGNARGSFRDAETLLDQCISFAGKNKELRSEDIKSLLGMVEAGQVLVFIDAVLSKKAKDAIACLNSFADSGVDLQEFAKTLIYYLRQIMLVKIDPGIADLQSMGLSEKELEKIKEQALVLSEAEIRKMLEAFIEAENKIKYNLIPQLPLELAIIYLSLV